MTLGIDEAWPHLLAAAHEHAPIDRLAGDQLVEIYRDFLNPRTDSLCVLAHLGQSLDGCIATASGHSEAVTGPENIKHLHRLRALADAVLVGAGTVAHDNPQLTTRLVEGPSPMRVVLDPDHRLSSDFGIFQGGPPTLLLGKTPRMDNTANRNASVIEDWSPGSVLSYLRSKGIRRLFIEGGGVTVSEFVDAHCVDLLHICISPILIGQGKRGICSSVITHMNQAIRPKTRTVAMGQDQLFACSMQRAPLV